MNYKKLSVLMLIATFVSTLFYSASYPYIYAETVKVVSQGYISIEQVLTCLSTIVFCRLWNKYSDKLFEHYRVLLWTEIIVDIVLFADVIIRQDLKFYFLFNVITYALITRNLSCGGVKMRAKVNPTEKLREQFDNNNTSISAIATLLGVGFVSVFNPSLRTLFIFALIGNSVDNIFYLYIYNQIKRRG